MAMTATFAFSLFPLAAKSVSKACDALPFIKIENQKAERNGDLVSVDMVLDLDSLKLNRNRALLFLPALATPTDTLLLNPIGIYGSVRWTQLQRVGDNMSDDTELSLRADRKTLAEPISYSAIVPYDPALEGSDLIMIVESRACRNCLKDKAEISSLAVLKSPRRFELGEPMWMIPDMTALFNRERDTKNRALTGSAFIDFPVNKTEIFPLYRGNVDELAKIRASLDVVVNDPDVKLKKISIKGFASPEGPYANNVRLARERTESLRRWLADTYQIQDTLFVTDFEPEDWAGLRQRVASFDIEGREGILAVIDSDLSPDAKDAEIREKFPQQYQLLLSEIYPALRRSDYRIDYLVKDYEDAMIIESVMNRNPSKLSPEEFYIAAANHQPGTPEFAAIYALALKYYPDDPVCNYNMAVVALMQGDEEAAESRLAKVSEGPQKEWAMKKAQELRESHLSEKKHQ